ncbi:MAG: biopolymer transporter ExbD [Candidatus Omnitrophica bacterium]|nr:biopolymer transporter ExbD [Candidatus Omnitrophota bacterium]
MINIKGRNDYLVALESVAMTDIIMNMFIFFFISFSLIYTLNPARISKIDVKLPKASTAVALEGSEKLVLAITKEGKYYINDRDISAGSIKEAIKDRLKDNPDLSVILKVDDSGRFGAVAGVLDILNELNIQKVSVAAVKSAGKGG